MSDDQLSAAATRLQEAMPDAVLESGVYMGETTIVLAADRLVDVCVFLRDDPATRFDYLVDVTAIDWFAHHAREPRFDVVYHLRSIPLGHVLRLKVRVADLEPVPTVSGVWRLGDWAERETYDMFGIKFEGHPDLRRILLPEDWEDGFPLRKDFAIGGYGIWAADNVPFR